MLSLANVSVEQGLTYYEQEDYYSKEEGISAPKFVGKGVKEIGINGFNKKDFESLIRGYHPKTEAKIGQHKKKSLDKNQFNKSITKLSKQLARSSIGSETSEKVIHSIANCYDGKHHLEYREAKGIFEKYKSELIASKQGDIKTAVNSIGKCLGEISKSDRRAGIDATLSAPKSVSVLALVQGDKRVFTAHEEAVKEAFEQLEEKTAGTLVGAKGNREFQKTRNLIAAQFNHVTSRAGDPQLHTHSVIFNMTQRRDGEWRSLNNDEIYKQSKLLGVIYQNKLAEKIQALGYGIDVKSDGTFEVAGYKSAHLKKFSKRREQVQTASARIIHEQIINSELKKDGIYCEKQIGNQGEMLFKVALKSVDDRKYEVIKNGNEYFVKDLKGDLSFESNKENLMEQVNQKLNRHGVLKGRNVKSKVLFSDLKQRWHEEANEIGLTHPDKNNAIDVEWGKNIDTQWAVEHLSERKSVWNRYDNELETLSRNLGRGTYKQVQDAVENSWIIEKFGHVKNNKEAEGYKKLLAFEEQNRALAKHKAGLFKSVGSFEDASSIANSRGYTEGQAEGLTLALTSRDQVMAWVGVAGSGKSYALEDVGKEYERAGYHVRGYGPDAVTSLSLEDSAKIKCSTLDKFLLQRKSPFYELPDKPQLWVIDEASKLDTRKMNQLLRAAKEENARVILVGDYRQLSAVGAGIPFKDLLDNGVCKAELLEHRRQKNERLMEAVDLQSKENIVDSEKSFQLLKQDMTEVKDRAGRIDLVAQKYLSLSPEKREKTLVIADLNADRYELTDKLRGEFKKDGSIGQEDFILSILKNKQLTRAQAALTRYYDVGDVIVPTKRLIKEGMESGEQYDIVKVDNRKGLLYVKSGKSTKAVKASSDLMLYQNDKIAVSEGDVLRWRKNETLKARVNGHRLKITGIRNGEMRYVNLNTGQASSVALNGRYHLDYGLVQTTYGSQGQTADKAIILAESNVSRQSWYVGISRVKHEIDVVTDDESKLKQRVNIDRRQENSLEYTEKSKGWVKDWTQQVEL